MNRLLLAPATALTFLLLAAGPAAAQNYTRPGYYNPYLNQPRLSPYLNIVGRGGNPAVNYFLGTLPEIERRSVQAVYGQAINNLQREIQGEITATEDYDGMQETGHPAMFNNLGGYFPTGNPLRYGSAPVPRQAAPAARKGR